MRDPFLGGVGGAQDGGRRAGGRGVDVVAHLLLQVGPRRQIVGHDRAPKVCEEKGNKKISKLGPQKKFERKQVLTVLQIMGPNRGTQCAQR